MVQTTTKISTHVLKLLYDISKGDSGLRWGRRGKGGRGSRGRGCRISWGCIRRLHPWLLCSKLHCTLQNRLLANGTHDIEMRKVRDGDVHMGEDTRDSQRKDELITFSHVMIAVNDRLYHVWRKLYRKTFHKRKMETSMRLSDGVIVWSWSENKGHHHIKEPWSLSELSCGEISVPPHNMAFSQKSEANLSQEMEVRRGWLG